MQKRVRKDSLFFVLMLCFGFTKFKYLNFAINTINHESQIMNNKLRMFSTPLSKETNHGQAQKLTLLADPLLPKSQEDLLAEFFRNQHLTMFLRLREPYFLRNDLQKFRNIRHFHP